MCSQLAETERVYGPPKPCSQCGKNAEINKQILSELKTLSFFVLFIFAIVAADYCLTYFLKKEAKDG
jgi:hypothetical protein